MLSTQKIPHYNRPRPFAAQSRKQAAVCRALTGQYHRDVYLPPEVRRLIPHGVIRPVYTDHALRACTTDRYGAVAPPDSVDLADPAADIFEVELCRHERSGRAYVGKVAMRIPYDALFDLTLVVAFHREAAAVKTLWLNLREDTHGTLRRDAYVQPRR